MRDDDREHQRRNARGAELAHRNDRTPGRRSLVDADHARALHPNADLPGRLTLIDAASADHSDPAVEMRQSLAQARARLTTLDAANRERDPSASAQVASDIDVHLQHARQSLQAADREKHASTRALASELAAFEAEANPLLAVAFRPSAATIRAAVNGDDRTTYDEEAAAWKAGASAKEPSAATIAARVTRAPGERLPHFDRIQASFGSHDVSGIRAHVGGEAAAANRQLGARGFAFGEHVAFASTPDLHTAAHEAAHYVQQRAGVALKGGIDQPGDEYEQHADQVADAVVRGESAAPLLDGFAGQGARAGAASPTVQRKTTGGGSGGGSVPSANDTYAIARKHDVHFGAVTGSLTLAISLTSKGTTRGKVAGGDFSVLDRSTTLVKLDKGLDASISATAASLTDKIWDGALPGDWGHLPLSMTLQVKGLEAGLSLKKMDLKLMSAVCVISGDFSGLLPADVRQHVQAKGYISLAFPLEPGLAKQLLELSQASDDVKRGAEFEAKVAKTEDELAHWQRLKTSAGEIEKLEPSVANLRRAAPNEIRKLEAELDKLRGLRGKVSDLRRRALVKIEQIGLKLEGKVAGRLLMKVGTKALGFVFKKFLPIYNAVSTARDLFEAGRYLAGLDWSSIGRTIMDGSNVQGTHFGDGSKHDQGTGVPGENASPDDPGSATDIERELASHENVKLHPAAAAVLSSLQAPSATANGARSISDRDRESINAVVPQDLSAQEIERVKKALAQRTSGTDQQDIVEAVIAVVQEARPNGEKPDAASEAESDSQVDAVGAKHGNAVRPKKKVTVDPTNLLRHRILVNRTNDPEVIQTVPIEKSRVDAPASITFDGVTAALTDVVAVPFGDEGMYAVRVHLKITGVPSDSAAEFADHTPVQLGTVRTIVYYDDAPDAIVQVHQAKAK